MADDTALVRFDAVGMQYDGAAEVLRDISFALDPGSYHFLTGPSGAGKSTMMRLLYLAQRPSAGRISLFGREADGLGRSDRARMRQRIGVVFQDFRLLPHLSAFDNAALPLRILKTPEAELRRDVMELLAWVGLGDQADASPATLSGGQQQRLAIARAVVVRPRLLLADEPTGNLDAEMGLKLMHLFEELNKLGTTIVVATHDTTLLARFRHPRLVLADGTVRLMPPAPPLRIGPAPRLSAAEALRGAARTDAAAAPGTNAGTDPGAPPRPEVTR
ncbi:cell division ATP-binding protein FtsE [Tistrella bauzanensis]|uniref:Cell division ATP-binding protein FtsE n=1 Tax=Tistrella bauzanensis TaxID=657419 RepID=A0ABQ1IEC1_9PROT|nr:ATP-binding cassette domain-containing protein [Tistrella bauzanensis]GGB35596.1 cell division ATP-binding protein FtsE [Tistrella bauzanensis]